MSIGSSATNTRPSGALQTTEGCRIFGGAATTSIFHSGGQSGRSRLAGRLGAALQATKVCAQKHASKHWLIDTSQRESELFTGPKNCGQDEHNGKYKKRSIMTQQRGCCMLNSDVTDAACSCARLQSSTRPGCPKPASSLAA